MDTATRTCLVTVPEKRRKEDWEKSVLRVEALPAAADHRLDHNEQAQQQGDDDARPPGGERPLEGDEGLDHTLISTPRRVPGRKATPPDISVPPITEEAMASISMLTAWRGYPESMMRE